MPVIEIYSKLLCPYCSRAKRSLDRLSLNYSTTDITFNPRGRKEMLQRSGRHTVPQIFVEGYHIGGSDDLEDAIENGLLRRVLSGDIPTS